MITHKSLQELVEKINSMLKDNPLWIEIFQTGSLYTIFRCKNTGGDDYSQIKQLNGWLTPRETHLILSAMLMALRWDEEPIL
jgi:hypothetical protein